MDDPGGDTDSDSSSSSSSSSSSNSPLLPSKNPFFKFFQRYRKDRRPDLHTDFSHSTTSVDTAGHDSNASSLDLPKEPIKEFHPTAADTYGVGKTVLDEIHESDQFAKQRGENVYFPFASKEDWEMGAWLIQSGLSMAEIDKFLKLSIVSLVREIWRCRTH